MRLNFWRSTALRNPKVRAIAGTAMVMVIITALWTVVMLTLGLDFFDRQRFWEPIFLSWVAGVALFGFSVVIALAQLDDPFAEGSSRRMAILMQGQEGPHVDYFLNKFREAEQYAEIVEKTFVFQEVTDDGARALLDTVTKITLRNFISDVGSTYSQPIGFSTDVPGASARVLYMKVDEADVSLDQFIPGPSFRETYPISIEPGKSVTVEFAIRRWVDPARLLQSNARFSRAIKVFAQNNTSANLSYECRVGTLERLLEHLNSSHTMPSPKSGSVKAGGKAILIELNEVPPGAAYLISVAAPESPTPLPTM